MKISYTIFLSGSNLKKRKLRSFLTIGGMAIGIALIVYLISIGFGLQRMIVNQIANVEQLSVLDVSKGESTLLALNDDVINEFNNIDSVDKVSPSLSLSGQVNYNESQTDAAIYGIAPDFLSLEGIKVSYGEPLVDDKAPQIIITDTALNLIGLGDPKAAIGEKLKLTVLVPTKIEGTEEEELVSKDVEVTIVGALRDEDELSIAYVPINFLIDLGFNPDYSQAKVKVGEKSDQEYSVAKIKVEDESKLPEVRAAIEQMGYQVDSVADTVGQIDQIFVVFEVIVSGFGAIAMFVAAIGSLNTLTVSLLERTREIGLMKTLGATSRDILTLFLVEAVVIGMTGGLVGIVLGWAAGEGTSYLINYLANKLGGDNVDIFYTPFIFILLIIGVILFISILTGLYPARRAGKINALDALRYE